MVERCPLVSIGNGNLGSGLECPHGIVLGDVVANVAPMYSMALPRLGYGNGGDCELDHAPVLRLDKSMH
jgi:hypothetical protein